MMESVGELLARNHRDLLISKQKVRQSSGQNTTTGRRLREYRTEPV